MGNSCRAGNIALLALVLVAASSVDGYGDTNIRRKMEQENLNLISKLYNGRRETDSTPELETCKEDKDKLVRLMTAFGSLVEQMITWRPSRDFVEEYIYGGCLKPDQSSSDYFWMKATTANGRVCQAWKEQFPHEHSNTNGSQYPEGILEGAQNYCRDPDNSGYVWCYTTDPDVRWEVCDVTPCLLDDSDTKRCYDFMAPSTEYSGTQDRTVEGLTCQRWASQFPHEHRFTDSSKYPEGDINAAENYCRDPEGWGLPWCYTTDPNKRWGVCDLAKCTERLPIE